MPTIATPSDTLRFGMFEVDFEHWELRRKGRRIKLQRKPFQILRRLLERPGELVTRSDLARLLWPELHVDFERSLNSAVNVLRQALGDSSRSCRFIETCPGIGYRFIAPVEPVDAPQLPPVSMPEAARQPDCRRASLFYDKMTREGFARAAAYYQAALDADPQCADAYAGLAEIQCRRAIWGLSASASAGREARTLAERALEIAPALPTAQAMLATAERILGCPTHETESALAKAVQSAPASASVRSWYADFLAADGRTREALDQLDAAEQIAPSSLIVQFQRAWTLYIRRDFRSAMEASWNALVLEPGFAPAQYTLGLVHAQLNECDDAITELENARALSGHPAVLASLCQVLASNGEQQRANALLAELDAMAEVQYVSRYSLALAYLAVRGKQAAFDQLARARDEGDVLTCWLALDPRFDALKR